MWPKAIAQLIELLPHVSRLLPLADRFLSSKSADAEASRTAMEQMAQGLRGDLGQVTASHAGLYRQLNEQSERLGQLTADIHSAKASVDTLNTRLTSIETKLRVLLLVTCLGLIIIMILAVAILLRH
jgi:septal ring factor EnvC (AmiA/AmiB activator)